MMLSRLLSALLVALPVAATAGASPALSAGRLVETVSPDGPITTITAALADAQHRYNGEPEIAIAVQPGVYSEGGIVLQLFSPSIRKLSVTGVGGPERVIFDGTHAIDPNPARPAPRGWLTVKAQAGRPSNVTLEGMTVRNFFGGLLFYGGDDQNTEWNGGNTVRNMIFRNIGVLDQSDAPSFAALMLKNSRDNQIVGNRFVKIWNTLHCRGMHAIYLRNNSSHNVIRDNVFDQGCGDQIKFRNGSNDNLVTDNVFSQQTGIALAVDSYCGPGGGSCSGIECPSSGNIVQQSTVRPGPDGTIPLLVRTVGRPQLAQCGGPAEARLRANPGRQP